MSLAYDEYLSEHIGAVQKGWNWMIDNLIDRIHPWIREQYPNSEFDPIDILEISEQMQNHDASKIRPEEYYPYDAYFYGGNKSHAVVENFQKAFLLHIHENPHHWQYWVLIHDDPDEPETLVEIPLNYIFEMVCDWWSFSWRKDDLMEIFNWWDEHKDYIRMHKKSRKVLEYILKEMKDILTEGKAEEKPEEPISHADDHLEHHGIKGQKWGVRRFQNEDGTRTNKGKEREYYRRRVIRELKNIDDVNQIVSTLSDIEQRELGLSSGDDKWIPDEKRIDQASNIAKTFLEYDGDIPISMLEIWDIGDGRADIALATDPKYRGTGATSRNIKNAIKWFNSKENTKFNELQWNNLKENPKSGEIADHYGFGDYIDDDKWEYRRIFKNEGKITHSDISEEKEDKKKFGLPDLKKYPMPDPDHVKSAIRFFNYVDPKHEKELAEAILERMKEYNMSFEDFGVGDENRFKKYIPKADQKDTEDKKSD